MTFSVPQLIIDKYHEGVAEINNVFGVDCKLFYPAERTICTNCEFNPVTNASSNIYKSSGPIVFEGTICPYCDGIGYTNLEALPVTIKMRCYFDVKNSIGRRSWTKLPEDYKSPTGAMQSYGLIDDLPKCQRCSYIIPNTNVGGHGNNRYRLDGEPILHGIGKNRYFIAYWDRLV